MKKNHFGYSSFLLFCCALFAGGVYAPKDLHGLKKRSNSIDVAQGGVLKRRGSVGCCDAAAAGTIMLSAEEDDDVRRAAGLLKAGELVALPTETVYGLGADASNPEAVTKIFAAKDRPDTHPLIVHLASPEDIDRWAKNVPHGRIARLVGANFMPGPLTVILDKADWVPGEVTGGKATIGLRLPKHTVFQKVLRLMGKKAGIAAPSANLHLHTSTTNAKDVIEELGGRIAAVLDGDECDEGMESTIVDLTGEVPRLLRPGPITKEQLEAALGERVADGHECAEGVPGAMKTHYQPITPAFLMSMDEIQAVIAPKWRDRVAVLNYSPLEGRLARRVKLITLPPDSKGYAHNMFAMMHEADRLGCSRILIERPPTTWAGVLDRLLKATARL